MKQFTVTDGRSEFLMNLPTKISEITSDYLLSVTEDIIVSPYHAVVATIYRCKLPEVISTSKKSRAMAIAIVPIYVKSNLPLETEKPTFDLIAKIKCGDKIIIAGTDLERGYQLSTPKNFITIENVVKIYNHDKEFAKGVMADQNYYYFVDFKLVPINDIKGFYNTSNMTTYVNPFVSTVKYKGTEVKGN